jgi:hypothetical protein
MKGREY